MEDDGGGTTRGEERVKRKGMDGGCDVLAELAEVARHAGCWTRESGAAACPGELAWSWADDREVMSATYIDSTHRHSSLLAGPEPLLPSAGSGI